MSFLHAAEISVIEPIAAAPPAKKQPATNFLSFLRELRHQIILYIFERIGTTFGYTESVTRESIWYAVFAQERWKWT